MKYWIILIALLYLFSPMDLVPERIVGPFGLIDDLIVLGALYWYFVYRPARLKAQGWIAGDGEKEGGRSGESPRSVPEPDPHEILGVAKDASADEIKHAYRELANKYHPDKVSHLGEEFKAIADKRFKEIQWAYEELMPK